ncbi:MAG: UDP-N-acetylmuramate dehydrogenase [Actinobacteria bacterium]|nr:UDP-N-acetylmuramate dehydrogenase [Actinomycetota bacterium]HPE11439.1 UDP-N-acetylmuramate dehydrogenase [Actinomycetota bacterium]HPQ82856.1 UDP-N-acetylmuramate dehydrogenase [Actinomycetota bacterium]
MRRALSEFTTIRLGGDASVFEATTQAELVEVLRDAPDIRVLGGGSNVVAADEGVREPVVRITASGWTRHDDQFIVAAGTPWDEFVAAMVEAGRYGVEALSGIPGSAGATPIQNVGAYGQEVSETIAGLRVLDRRSGEITTWPAARAGFGYRDSFFKRNPGSYVVLAVAFDLPKGSSAPIKYAELARELGVETGRRAPLRNVRETVLRLRAGKGMVLDAEDPDTCSVGSFFTNPFVEVVPEGAPGWAQPDGRIKTSAAWLIENAGVHKGFRLPGAQVAVSSKHTLALTNRGGGTTAQLLDLAREIRSRVEGRFGITLEPEPVLWGCSL